MTVCLVEVKPGQTDYTWKKGGKAGNTWKMTERQVFLPMSVLSRCVSLVLERDQYIDEREWRESSLLRCEASLCDLNSLNTMLHGAILCRRDRN